MKKIVVCTDFSANAKAAVNYALSLAQFYGAELMLVHSYMVPVPVSEIPPSIEMYEQIKKDSELQLERAKLELEEKNKTGATISTHLENENLLIILEELNKKIKPDLFVLGTRGHRDFVDVLVGSNTMKVVNHLPAPVLIVPSAATFKPVKKIGFACDFDKVVETTPLDLLNKLVKDFDAELHVINVDYKNKHFTPDTPEQSMLLDHLLFKMKPRYHFLEGKNMAEITEVFVEKNQIDLLITIPKKHSFFEKFFKGTHTRQLVYHTNIPLLCIHEK
ncbi:MAG TPA: universal stress protein [Chitinophagaceae bacterium]|nr:universal stress protein [Chitinophagaceae bacterium]